MGYLQIDHHHNTHIGMLGKKNQDGIYLILKDKQMDNQIVNANMLSDQIP